MRLGSRQRVGLGLVYGHIGVKMRNHSLLTQLRQDVTMILSTNNPMS